ncbi:MAG: AtpZ/AtpI family protein [Elusimicrobiaceae bacterium]|nr:AtpZ/AtpI family protein [Elusimicrobiaceae bacterium]
MSLGPFSRQEHLVITTLGLEFAVAELLGGALGIWLDKKWETSPWMLVLGVLGGFTLGMYRIIRFAQEMDRQGKTAEKENGRY